MKYDCTKTRDCIHEFRRLCDSYPAGCESSCPFFEIDETCGFDIFKSEAAIASLQKWSDEHPEKPKLTPEEAAFLRTFKVAKYKYIARYDERLFFVLEHDMLVELWPTMFPFIKDGNPWAMEDLLKLEVEE